MESDSQAPPVEPQNADVDTQTGTEAAPFVGRWNRLISATNWEKGKIIHQWRQSLIESGVDASQYSDEVWSRTVGGVTSPHVGRLRRVYERFGSSHQSYPGLYWSHFLAAIEWDDAEMWLEGASQSGWTVADMRSMRWEANGSNESEKPQKSDIVDAELDEDNVEPAQGGGGAKRFDEDEQISSEPIAEGPDFGDESSPAPGGATSDAIAMSDEITPEMAQPFAGLPELPDDLGEALEMFKLAIIRHKSSQWSEVRPEVVLQALGGLKTLVEQPSH